ncbi:DUF58 domain-containing protein [Nocardioides cynanchi]|uniref:DUF58 domain-containing protein n=1 Tax=Nocardioides cynanchi TaxID=2558918 RepID=UPI00124634FB|nr:DUF58 domain-containing protein [Nocardioides cynanchi]
MSPTDRARGAWGVVNPLGRVVVALGLLLAVVAGVAHWREVAVLSAACLLLMLLALPFLVGRTSVRVDLRLQPERVTAGESVAASVTVTNLAPRRMLPTLLEVAVGPLLHRYAVPALGAAGRRGDSTEENLTIRTERRGVIPVGPVLTRRGDPLGLSSVDIRWTGVTEIMVRPPMVGLEALGAGLLRDLEGVSTDALSQSDLAFHALREYSPGDDLRHVHWRSSAKAMAASGDTALLVRQYLDTRRSHATVVVDDDPGGWTTTEDFETAMSVAASIIRRSILDELDVSFVCGRRAATGVSGHLALDALCRAETGDVGLVRAAQRAATAAPDTSVLFLLSGALAPFADLQRAAAAFPPEVRRFALVVDPDAAPTVTEAAGLPVLRLATKDDAPALLQWSVR